MKCAINRIFRLNSLLTGALAVAACLNARGSDIAPMTWSASQRSGWINVTSPGAYTEETSHPNATGDGTTDDTAAIQGVLNYFNDHTYSDILHKTLYFPPGTYRITSTLHLTAGSTIMAGCGLNTVMKWDGPAGKPMLWHDGAGGNFSRFVGFVWDGGGTAGSTSTGANCGVLEYSSTGGYMTNIRHENESFRNFRALGDDDDADTHDSANPGGYPGTGILSGLANANAVGELTIFNCAFSNCTQGINNAADIFQNFMWCVDGCEFENNNIGFNGAFGGCNMVLNSHFQNSSVCDVAGGFALHCQRLTSSGSQMFFSGPGSSQVLEDCWVDGWANTNGAVQFSYQGQMTVFDCTFTNPPAGSLGAVWLYEDSAYGQDLLLSNNFPSGSSLLHQQVATKIDWVPGGSLPKNITAASQTFIHSAEIDDSTHILDVTSSTFNPSGATPTDLTHDWTSTIQAAINAAASANNGSIVYLPGGFYGISSTLTLTGGNYSIEGEGLNTEVCWIGGSNATMLSVTTPQNIAVRQIQLAAASNTSADAAHTGYPSYGRPVCDPTTITSILETSTGASSATYDNVLCFEFPYDNPGASVLNTNGPGLSLSGLPAGSTVYVPVLSSALTVSDCGQAKILSKMAYMGAVNISGSTYPKTGQLGLVVAEGGQSDGRTGSNTGLYNFTINDNQNLTVGSYYTEQGGNDIEALRGAVSDSPGHVAILGMVSSPTPDSTTVSIDDYLGRFFYGAADLAGNASQTYPVQVEQDGYNPVDLILANNFYNDSSPANYSVDAGANLISTLNAYDASSITQMTDSPNPLTSIDLTKIATSLDDFRQLGALNLNVEYGLDSLSGLVGYWKLDETASPSVDSSMSGCTGTWNNSPTTTPDHPPMIPYADAGSMSFNGTNQSVSMSNVAALPSGNAPRTLSAWAKLNTSTPGYYFIAGYGAASTNNAFIIGVESWGSGGNNAVDGGGWDNDLQAANTFDDNNWHLVTLTYDGTTERLYFDGTLKTSQAIALNTVLNSGSIGNLFTGIFPWQGSIDDVRIYNRALSAAEVSSLYAPPGEVLPIATTGYSNDVVYGPANGDTTATSYFQGYHFYAAGQGSDGGAGGLPVPNLLQSETHPNVVFQFQPYDAPNILALQGNSGTLTLTAPAKYSNVAVLLVNAGTGGVNITLNFSDGSQTTTTYSSLSYWAYTDPATTGGFLASQDSYLVGDATPISLGEYDIPLSATDSAKTLNSVTFTEINYGSGTLGIFGLSGSAN